MCEVDDAVSWALWSVAKATLVGSLCELRLSQRRCWPGKPKHAPGAERIDPMWGEKLALAFEPTVMPECHRRPSRPVSADRPTFSVCVAARHVRAASTVVSSHAWSRRSRTGRAIPGAGPTRGAMGATHRVWADATTIRRPRLRPAEKQRVEATVSLGE